MDTAVDDFLKEVNELLPPEPKILWKECFDKASGFAYYWNTETDEVTWEPPVEYKKHTRGSNKLFIPPPAEPKYKLRSLPKVDEVNVKIYKINEGLPVSKNVKDKVEKLESVNKRKALISSYGSSSESESENEKVTETELKETDDTQSDPSDFDDEVDILTQIQKKAKDLKKLGGEIPTEVKKLIEVPVLQKKISLVPGYASEDSDEEFENPQSSSLTTEDKEFGPLFSNLKNVDIPNQPPSEINEDVEIDTKVFQRKRRIGVSLMNTAKKIERNEGVKEQESIKKIEYPGFKRGGVLFGNICENDGKIENNDVEEPCEVDKDDELVEEIKGVKTTLEEKLKFLCEGRREALPVQVMIIQMETLFTAMCQNCLKPKYLKNWLNLTLEDLTKLERDAAPTGWLLQWDRMHKRYYYHNQTTGESQWEYPSSDVIRTEEAMDISMTPPHTTCDENPLNANLGNVELVVPPPPPTIREKSISPPPPPIISKQLTHTTEQPLPPGVDETVEKINGKTEHNGSLSSELNSFYSDIAAIENNQPQSLTQIDPEVAQVESISVQPPKKKKKVKVSSGLAMKKKGVSQMVEKWKNLQKNYD